MDETRENTPDDPTSRETEASRRQFLATSALFAGAAAALSAGCQSLSGGSAPVAPVKAGGRTPVKDGEPIRIGIIGVGGMGGAHLEGLLLTTPGGRENVEIVAISDVAKPKLEGAVSRAAEVQRSQVDGYRDYRELLARKDVDAVYIAVPLFKHFEIVKAALQAGNI